MAAGVILVLFLVLQGFTVKIQSAKTEELPVEVLCIDENCKGSISQVWTKVAVKTEQRFLLTHRANELLQVIAKGSQNEDYWLAKVFHTGKRGFVNKNNLKEVLVFDPNPRVVSHIEVAFPDFGQFLSEQAEANPEPEVVADEHQPPGNDAPLDQSGKVEGVAPDKSEQLTNQPILTSGERVAQAGQTVAQAGQTVAQAGQTVAHTGQTAPEQSAPQHVNKQQNSGDVTGLDNQRDAPSQKKVGDEHIDGSVPAGGTQPASGSQQGSGTQSGSGTYDSGASTNYFHGGTGRQKENDVVSQNGGGEQINGEVKSQDDRPLKVGNLRQAFNAIHSQKKGGEGQRTDGVHDSNLDSDNEVLLADIYGDDSDRLKTDDNINKNVKDVPNDVRDVPNDGLVSQGAQKRDVTDKSVGDHGDSRWVDYDDWMDDDGWIDDDGLDAYEESTEIYSLDDIKRDAMKVIKEKEEEKKQMEDDPAEKLKEDVATDVTKEIKPGENSNEDDMMLEKTGHSSEVLENVENTGINELQSQTETSAEHVKDDKSVDETLTPSDTELIDDSYKFSDVDDTKVGDLTFGSKDVHSVHDMSKNMHLKHSDQTYKVVAGAEVLSPLDAEDDVEHMLDIPVNSMSGDGSTRSNSDNLVPDEASQPGDQHHKSVDKSIPIEEDLLQSIFEESDVEEENEVLAKTKVQTHDSLVNDVSGDTSGDIPGDTLHDVPGYTSERDDIKEAGQQESVSSQEAYQDSFEDKQLSSADDDDIKMLHEDSINIPDNESQTSKETKKKKVPTATLR